MMEERRQDNRIARWFLYFIALLTVTTLINIAASFTANDFGMSPPDLMSEYYLIVLYVIIGSILFFFMGRVKLLPKVLRFGFRLLILMFTVATCHNQLAISHELAPVKKEFAKAAGTCFVKPNGEMKCGKQMDRVIAARQEMLAKLDAVIINDWKIDNSRVNTFTKTSAIYIKLPL